MVDSKRGQCTKCYIIFGWWVGWEQTPSEIKNYVKNKIDQQINTDISLSKLDDI